MNGQKKRETRGEKPEVLEGMTNVRKAERRKGRREERIDGLGEMDGWTE